MLCISFQIVYSLPAAYRLVAALTCLPLLANSLVTYVTLNKITRFVKNAMPQNCSSKTDADERLLQTKDRLESSIHRVNMHQQFNYLITVAAMFCIIFGVILGLLENPNFMAFTIISLGNLHTSAGLIFALFHYSVSRKRGSCVTPERK